MSSPRLRTALALAAAAACHLAAAQALPPGAVPRAPEPTPTTPRPGPDLAGPARPALPADAGLRVQVDRFLVSGNTLLAPAEIDQALAGYTGRALGFAELQAAADTLTRLYRARGWLLALAYLPQQRLQGGTVEIAVLEGRLGRLQMSGGTAGTGNGFLESMLGWRLAPGQPVGQDNLVRNLLVANDLPGLTLNAEVRPGTEVGTADVQVALQPAAPPWAGTLVLDNHGSRYTGRLRLGGSLAVAGLAGRGDLLNVQGLATQGGGQQSLQAGYALPVHASGTLLSLSLAGVRYQITDPELRPLQAEGRAATALVALEQPLLRRPDLALHARFGLSHRALRDDLAAVAVRDHRHIDAAQAGLRVLWRPAAWPGSQVQASLTLEAGRVGFDDAQAELADAVGLQTAGRYQRLNLELAKEVPLTDTLLLRSRLLAQASDGNLDAANRMVLGGPNALRPYGDRAVSADDAVLLGVELRWRPPQQALPGLAASVFADYGQGRASHRPLAAATGNTVKAATWGLGVEVPLPYNMSVRAALARQAVSPRTSGERWETRGWFEWVKAF